jgi:uncharacterized Zn-binding protein involved in type VI secretion
MALPLARVGDECGGAIITGSGDVFINGLPAAYVSSHILPHPYGDHVHVATIQTGSGSIFINGQPAAQLGSIATCSVHTVSTASTSVFGG